MTTRSITYRREAGGPVSLIVDGEPVPVEATLIIPAAAVAELIGGTVDGTAKAYTEFYTEAIKDAVRQAYAAGTQNGTAQGLNAGGALDRLREVFTVRERVIEKAVPVTTPAEVRVVSMPDRVARRQVVRDDKGLIVETIEAEVDA